MANITISGDFFNSLVEGNRRKAELEKENAEITAAHTESIEAMNASYKADIETYKAEQNLLGVAISTLTADKRTVNAAIEDIKIYCNNPSAWEYYDDGVSEKIRAILKAAGMA